MPMITSPAGRTAIMQREGIRLRAYRDTRGLWTIGAGHCAGAPRVTPGMRAVCGVRPRYATMFTAAETSPASSSDS